MRRFLPAALSLAGLLLAGPAPADRTTDVDKINKKIDAFTLTDAAGKKFALADQKAKAVVVVFLSFECPVSNSYAPVLKELHKAYAGKDVAFVGINASDDVTAA